MIARRVFTISALFVLMLGAPVAHALTEGPYTYEISNGEATITEFDRYFSGTLAITNTLGGCPVTTIGENAFFEHAVSAVIIPETVISIGPGPFVDCGNLTNISVKNDNPNYSATNGVLFDKNCTSLIQYPPGLNGGYEIPYGVTVICQDAFQHCCYLTEVTMPSTVTDIGDRAFLACFALTNAPFSSGLIRIGDSAFYFTGMTLLNIPDSVTSIGDHAFMYCYDLSSVSIGNSVTSIGGWSFYDCNSLTSVLFTGNAPEIGTNAFYAAPATIYYIPNTTGWGAAFAGRPTLCWNPTVQHDAVFGFSSNRFGFNIAGTTNIPVKVEATTNLASGVWTHITNATLNSSGLLSVSDPASSSLPARFYRVAFP